MQWLQEPGHNLVSYFEFMDSTDKIFGIIRAFYISARMVSEKLSDKNGFSSEERKGFLNTLVNFTDFSQLRLVLMGIQFLDYYQASKYLRDDVEFQSVLKEVGLHLDPY
ncbi:hypothetical protein KDW20_13285 [Burkholderia cenocepacia]|nr:hypothetical protein [Burkholderia cenocepacia]